MLVRLCTCMHPWQRIVSLDMRDASPQGGCVTRSSCQCCVNWRGACGNACVFMKAAVIVWRVSSDLLGKGINCDLSSFIPQSFDNCSNVVCECSVVPFPVLGIEMVKGALGGDAGGDSDTGLALVPCHCLFLCPRLVRFLPCRSRITN